jgi:hypothetical protein
MALGALVLAGCGTQVGVAPHEVQEGHGGDGFAATFVHAGQTALSEFKNGSSLAAGIEFSSVERLEWLLQSTPTYSTEDLAKFEGTSLTWKGVEYARITPALRGGRRTVMLSRPYFRPLIANDQVGIVSRIANLAVKAYSALDSGIHLPGEFKFKYVGYGADLSGRSLREYALQMQKEIDASALASCSGWAWFQQLVNLVPVIETDKKLVEWTTGHEVDSVVVRNEGSAGWKIFVNRARIASTPAGVPRALLSIHEYLRASEVPAIGRDESYRVSSLMFQNALSAAGRALPAATGFAVVIGTSSETICASLQRVYGLPK